MLQRLSGSGNGIDGLQSWVRSATYDHSIFVCFVTPALSLANPVAANPISVKMLISSFFIRPSPPLGPMPVQPTRSGKLAGPANMDRLDYR